MLLPKQEPKKWHTNRVITLAIYYIGIYTNPIKLNIDISNTYLEHVYVITDIREILKIRKYEKIILKWSVTCWWWMISPLVVPVRNSQLFSWRSNINSKNSQYSFIDVFSTEACHPIQPKQLCYHTHKKFRDFSEKT